MAVYNQSAPKTTGVPDRRRYSVRKAIEKLKAEIPLELYAGELAELKRQGRNLVGLCPIHDEKTPSFAVYPDGHFYCFGCKHHGDLIDLCELAERHADTRTAVVSLSMRFGVELPQRQPRWFGWQDEKAKVREDARHAIARIYQRRLTRVFAPLAIVGGETPEEEREALEELADALWPRAFGLAGRRVAGEG